MIANESHHEHDSSRAETEQSNPAIGSPKLSHRAASYDRGVQIAAAQLRLVTDRRLGIVTPQWIEALAQEDPHTS